MATEKPVSLRRLIQRGALARLDRDASRLEISVDTLRPALPASIRPHLTGAGLRGNVLVLVSDSAAWAARLRFYAKDVIKCIALIHNSRIERVDVKVRPRWGRGEDSV